MSKLDYYRVLFGGVFCKPNEDPRFASLCEIVGRLLEQKEDGRFVMTDEERQIFIWSESPPLIAIAKIRLPLGSIIGRGAYLELYKHFKFIDATELYWPFPIDSGMNFAECVEGECEGEGESDYEMASFNQRLELYKLLQVREPSAAEISRLVCHGGCDEFVIHLFENCQVAEHDFCVGMLYHNNEYNDDYAKFLSRNKEWATSLKNFIITGMQMNISKSEQNYLNCVKYLLSFNTKEQIAQHIIEDYTGGRPDNIKLLVMLRKVPSRQLVDLLDKLLDISWLPFHEGFFLMYPQAQIYSYY